MQEFYEKNGKLYCKGCEEEMTLVNAGLLKEYAWCMKCEKKPEDNSKSRCEKYGPIKSKLKIFNSS